MIIQADRSNQIHKDRLEGFLSQQHDISPGYTVMIEQRHVFIKSKLCRWFRKSKTDEDETENDMEMRN